MQKESIESLNQIQAIIMNIDESSKPMPQIEDLYSRVALSAEFFNRDSIVDHINNLLADLNEAPDNIIEKTKHLRDFNNSLKDHLTNKIFLKDHFSLNKTDKEQTLDSKVLRQRSRPY